MNSLGFIVKFSLIWVLLICAGCDKPSVKVEKLPDNAVILAFGDSLTYGTGASEAQDYPAILSELLDLEVINDGVPGELSHQGAKRLAEALDDYQPDLLVLIHGGNDLLRGVPKQKINENLSGMIHLAKQRQIDVVLLGVPVPRLFLLQSAELYGAVAADMNVPADLDTLPLILSDNALKSDPIHPNDQGYRLLAENIRQLLIDAGAI